MKLIAELFILALFFKCAAGGDTQDGDTDIYGDGTEEILCPEGLNDCYGRCVDLETDHDHCGACGRECRPAEVCVEGECVLECPSGETDCLGTCVDLESDPSNCGACGRACGTDEVCSDGDCTSECSLGLTDCEGSCVDLDSDSHHCGSCGRACLPTHPCVAGSCSAWGSVSSTGVPSERCYHTAVWAGSTGAMIVWGGISGSGDPLSSGGLYFPESDTWRPTAFTSGSRHDHSAVWTGSEMIVWGGSNPTYGALAAGKVYDPDSNAWSDISELNGPEPRYYHAAVWLGDAMLIWGGKADDSSFFADGRLYDPLAGRWSDAGDAGLTARSGAAFIARPEAADPAAFIWGGADLVSVFDDGAVLVPPLNWTLLPRLPDHLSFSGRSWATAVWVDPFLVIWGGSLGENYFDNGARYSQGDGWLTVSETGAPEPRHAHTAVAADGELVVWGGWNGRFLGDGGRYDPVADDWTPLEESGLAPRCDHTAVWTGREMIIWGGESETGCTNSGSRWAPDPYR